MEAQTSESSVICVPGASPWRAASPAYLDDLTQIGAGRARTFHQDLPSRTFNHGTRAVSYCAPSHVRSHIDFMLTIS